MNTRGLMELVILNIGLDIGVISPALFSMMVIMALVTTFMTTPVLRLICAKELDESEADFLAKAADCAGNRRKDGRRRRLENRLQDAQRNTE